jgi:hypothetical protein
VVELAEYAELVAEINEHVLRRERGTSGERAALARRG